MSFLRRLLSLGNPAGEASRGQTPRTWPNVAANVQQIRSFADLGLGAAARQTPPAEVHCHCLPGLDDGPETMEASLALCRVMVQQGIQRVVATPHQLGKYDLTNDAARVRLAVAELSAELLRQGMPLEILPGADVRIDERMLDLLDQDNVLTVADRRRYILLELPRDVWIDVTGLIDQLLKRGIVPIMTHPERHPHLVRNPHLVQRWLEQGAVVQLTAGSLVGFFGDEAAKVSWQMVRFVGMVLIASDAHTLGRRRPCLPDAARAIADHLGVDAAVRMCLQLPHQIASETSVAKDA